MEISEKNTLFKGRKKFSVQWCLYYLGHPIFPIKVSVLWKGGQWFSEQNREKNTSSKIRPLLDLTCKIFDQRRWYFFGYCQERCICECCILQLMRTLFEPRSFHMYNKTAFDLKMQIMCKLFKITEKVIFCLLGLNKSASNAKLIDK